MTYFLCRRSQIEKTLLRRPLLLWGHPSDTPKQLSAPLSLTHSHTDTNSLWHTSPTDRRHAETGRRLQDDIDGRTEPGRQTLSSNTKVNFLELDHTPSPNYTVLSPSFPHSLPPYILPPSFRHSASFKGGHEFWIAACCSNWAIDRLFSSNRRHWFTGGLPTLLTPPHSSHPNPLSYRPVINIYNSPMPSTQRDQQSPAAIVAIAIIPKAIVASTIQSSFPKSCD